MSLTDVQELLRHRNLNTLSLYSSTCRLCRAGL